jgi:transposase
LVAKLTEQVQLLVEKLGQDSSNSHLPPSSDGPGAAQRGQGRGGRSNKAKDKKNKRKRGGQKGHRGAHRELMPAQQVDKVIDMYPESCACCAGALHKTPDSNPRRHQMIDLSPFAPYVTEFRRHEVQCGRCDHRTRAAYDKERIPSSPFGSRLTAVVVMLTGVYHLSRDQTRQLLMELFGIKISTGTISAMEARTSEALVAAVAEAQQEVDNADVKHADGTSWLLAGITMSLWTLATAAATVYKIFKDGRRETIQPWFGKLVGILVSDRATVFGFWAMALRQICHAHLIRRFVSFSQRDGPAGAIGRELLDLSALVFEYWHGFKAGQLTRDELQAWLSPVQRQFEAVLQRAVAADIRGVSGSCADMLAHKGALWTFVTREGVEPTNNHAELMLRPLVLWRRRSFGCQSERGLRFVERVMTVTFTARKQGKNVLDFLEACVTAKRDGTTPPTLLAAAA